MNLVEKAKELKMEQKKSDALLFQMLPTSVAIRLKQTGRVSVSFPRRVGVFLIGRLPLP